MKIKETRRIDFYDLRNLCIRNNWYTRGSNDEYEKTLQFARRNDMNTENLGTVAMDIVKHSDASCFADCYANGVHPVEHVLFLLAEITTSLFFVEE